MKTCIHVFSRRALVKHIRKLLAPFEMNVESDDITVTYYVYDDRIQWKTFIVTVKGYGPIGFTNRYL